MLPLKVDQIKKTYTTKGKPPVDAVKGVSFEIHPGEIYGLLGPNGAGKTSIISTITTLETPTSGDVLVFGKSVITDAAFTKRQLGVVPQEIVHQGFFNVEEILGFHSGYYGIANNGEQIKFLLDRLGLLAHRHKLVKHLSGGMKRRLMIAKALVHKPKLLLLDEPTAGVDIELRSSLWKFVRELKNSGVSILLTTHYLEEAEELCDRVGVISQGQLLLSEETKKFIKKLTQRTVEVEFKDRSVKHYQLSLNQGVGDLFEKENINIAQILDVRTKEGSLEEAVTSVLKNGVQL